MRAGELLFCSGQLGLRDGVLVDGEHAQLAQAVTNVEAVLAAHGGGLDDVVKTTLFVTDLADFGALNTAYADALGGRRPARSAVQVAGLPLGAAVELEVVAWLGGR